MRTLKISIVCLFAAILLVCGGCTARNDFDAGEQLSAEELAALRAQLAAQENKPEEEKTHEIPQDGTVYWLEGGKVYHAVVTCYHIAKKENVCQGTLAEANEAGKERPCSACFGD